MTTKIRLLAGLSLAHFGQHRTRVVLTCLGIAIGVGAVAAVLALSRSIVSTFQSSVIQGAGVAQLQVSNGTAGLDRDLADTLSLVPGVAATGATVQHHLFVPSIGKRLTVFGVELGRDEAYREVQTGPDVADIPDVITFIANTDSIAVSDGLMTARGWKRGDVVDVVGARGTQSLTIRGALHPRGPLSVYGDDVALMDLDAAQLRFGAPDRVHWIDIVVAAGADVDGVHAAVASAIGGRGTVATPVTRGRRVESMLSLLRVLLTSASVLAMLVGVFLIHHTLSTSYRQRRGDLIRLRALGLSRWWLASYLIVEAAMLGLVASAVGVLAGIGLWLAVTDEFSTTISSLFVPMPPPRFALTGGEIAGALALGTIAVVIGALTPVVAMLRVRPLAEDEAIAAPTFRGAWGLLAAGVSFILASIAVAPLADGAGFARQVAVVGAMGACIFLGTTLLIPALLMASRPLLGEGLIEVWALLSRWTVHQVWRQRLHTATTIGALSCGVALAVAFTILLGSYRTAFRSWFDQTFVTGDVLVNSGPTISMLGGQTIGPELGSEIEALPGVAQVLRWRFMEVEYQGRPVVLQAISEEVLDRIYPAFADSDGVIVSDTLAEHFDLSVGDILTLPAPRRQFSARIKAVVPDYVLHLGSIKMGWKTFIEHFGDQRVSLFGANAREGVAPNTLKAEIDALVAKRYDVTTLTAGEVRHLVEHLVDQSVALTYWLQIVAALVALAAMVNATSASIIDRESELRTWRALGLLRWRLVRLLVGEAAVVGLVGSCLGLVSGALLGFLLTTEIARAVAGYRLVPIWPIVTFIGVPVLSTLAAAGAAWAVAFRWTRGRPLTNASVVVR